MEERDSEAIKQFTELFTEFVRKSINLARNSLSGYTEDPKGHMFIKEAVVSSFIDIIRKTLGSYSGLVENLREQSVVGSLKEMSDELSSTIKDLKLDLGLAEALNNQVSYPNAKGSQEMIISSSTQKIVNESRTYGLLFSQMGGFYQGEFKEGGIPDGYGTYYWPSNDIYMGEIKDRLPSVGYWFFSNGVRFVGKRGYNRKEDSFEDWRIGIVSMIDGHEPLDHIESFENLLFSKKKCRWPYNLDYHQDLDIEALSSSKPSKATIKWLNGVQYTGTFSNFKPCLFGEIQIPNTEQTDELNNSQGELEELQKISQGFKRRVVNLGKKIHVCTEDSWFDLKTMRGRITFESGNYYEGQLSHTYEFEGPGIFGSSSNPDQKTFCLLTDPSDGIDLIFDMNKKDQIEFLKTVNKEYFEDSEDYRKEYLPRMKEYPWLRFTKPYHEDLEDTEFLEFKGAWKDAKIANNSEGFCWVKINGKEIKGEVNSGIIYRTVGFSLFDYEDGKSESYEMDDAELRLFDGMKYQGGYKVSGMAEQYAYGYGELTLPDGTQKTGIWLRNCLVLDFSELKDPSSLDRNKLMWCQDTYKVVKKDGTIMSGWWRDGRLVEGTITRPHQNDGGSPKSEKVDLTPEQLYEYEFLSKGFESYELTAVVNSMGYQLILRESDTSSLLKAALSVFCYRVKVNFYNYFEDDSSPILEDKTLTQDEFYRELEDLEIIKREDTERFTHYSLTGGCKTSKESESRKNLITLFLAKRSMSELTNFNHFGVFENGEMKSQFEEKGQNQDKSDKLDEKLKKEAKVINHEDPIFNLEDSVVGDIKNLKRVGLVDPPPKNTTSQIENRQESGLENQDNNESNNATQRNKKEAALTTPNMYLHKSGILVTTAPFFPLEQDARTKRHTDFLDETLMKVLFEEHHLNGVAYVTKDCIKFFNGDFYWFDNKEKRFTHSMGTLEVNSDPNSAFNSVTHFYWKRFFQKPLLNYIDNDFY